MKRVIGAALAACALLWAGSAGAATVSGVVNQTQVRAYLEPLPGYLYEFSFRADVAPINLLVASEGSYNILYYDAEGRLLGGSWDAPTTIWNTDLTAPYFHPFTLRDGMYVGRFEVPNSYETFLQGSPDGSVRAVASFRGSMVRLVGNWDESAIGSGWDFNLTAVPEPATWAMMIIGFGAVGSMARASRRRSAFSVV